jgi:hypothetical protein
MLIPFAQPKEQAVLRVAEQEHQRDRLSVQTPKHDICVPVRKTSQVRLH